MGLWNALFDNRIYSFEQAFPGARDLSLIHI